MRQDFSWQRSGDAYAELYRSLTRTPTVQPAESNAPETDEPAKLTA